VPLLSGGHPSHSRGDRLDRMGDWSRMSARLAWLGLLALVVVPACDPCDDSFGVREPDLVVVLGDLDGALLDDAAAEAVLDAATVEVCWQDHGEQECSVLALRDVLADGETGSEAALDLDAVYEGVSDRTEGACLSPGLELTVAAPDCISASYDLPLENASAGEATGERKSLRFECPG
jgi:hypothetical protein